VSTRGREASAVTPGQAVYEAHHASQRRRFPGIAPIGWYELSAEAQAEWEVIAGAGTGTALAALRDQLATEAARLRGLLAAERERFRRAQAEAKRLRALVARRERARGAEKLLTPAEAAGMLHVHQRTLKRWADAGKVTPAWTAGKHRRYREAEVREMLRAREDRRAPDA